MHDLDQTQREYEAVFQERFPEEYEFQETDVHFHEIPVHEFEAPLHEAMELEMATELLEVSNEQELDHFLGSLISKVGRGIGDFVKSPIGRALGGVLKSVAKKALPIAGGALGSLVGGPVGGMLGGKLASAAGDMFGLELEGLSGEDREFEVARRFVRLGASATRHAARYPRNTHPSQAARAALMAAARQHAPGLLRRAGRPAGAGASLRPGFPGAAYAQPFDAPMDGSADLPPDDNFDDGAGADLDGGFDSPGPLGDGSQRRGTWVRRGRRIILFGV